MFYFITYKYILYIYKMFYVWQKKIRSKKSFRKNFHIYVCMYIHPPTPLPHRSNPTTFFSIFPLQRKRERERKKRGGGIFFFKKKNLQKENSLPQPPLSPSFFAQIKGTKKIRVKSILQPPPPSFFFVVICYILHSFLFFILFLFFIF